MSNILKSNVIRPDSKTKDSDLETIHSEWSLDSNVLFLTFHTETFEATIFHRKNLASISIDNIIRQWLRPWQKAQVITSQCKIVLKI
jgi:hypothetical protein